MTEKPERIKVAKFISLLFGLPWLFVLIPLVIVKSQVTTSQIFPLAAISIVFQLLIPLSYLAWGMKTGRISDLDITDRKERYGIMTVSIASFLVSLFLIKEIGNEMVFHMIAVSLLFLTVAYLITFFWKISMHMGVNMLSITILNVLYDWELWFLYAIVPFVYWSRRVLKKHTHLQLIFGIIVTFIVVYGGLRYFGYS